MKKKLLRRMLPAVLLPLAGLVVMIAINGCDLLGQLTGPDPVTVQQRLAKFITELNSDDRSSTYKNFHSTATLAYSQLYPAGYWDTGIWAKSKQPFTLGSYTPSAADANGIVTVTTTLASADPTIDIQFTLKEGEATVWYIVTCYTKQTTAADWDETIRTIGLQ